MNSYYYFLVLNIYINYKKLFAIKSFYEKYTIIRFILIIIIVYSIIVLFGGILSQWQALSGNTNNFLLYSNFYLIGIGLFWVLTNSPTNLELNYNIVLVNSSNKHRESSDSSPSLSPEQRTNIDNWTKEVEPSLGSNTPLPPLDGNNSSLEEESASININNSAVHNSNSDVAELLKNTSVWVGEKTAQINTTQLSERNFSGWLSTMVSELAEFQEAGGNVNDLNIYSLINNKAIFYVLQQQLESQASIRLKAEISQEEMQSLEITNPWDPKNGNGGGSFFGSGSNPGPSLGDGRNNFDSLGPNKQSDFLFKFLLYLYTLLANFLDSISNHLDMF